MTRPPAVTGSLRRHWILWLGILAILLPTLHALATGYWSTEEGAHGPIVLATGIWFLLRHRDTVAEVAKPGSSGMVTAALLLSLLAYVFGRVVGILGVEAFGAYAALLSVLYATVGGEAMKRMWFPLFYMLFLVPPPDTLVAAATQPMKIGISESVASFLALFGLPIVRAGVMMHIAQYELLVAAACSGLNSIISLSAISLFYVYFRHHANWRYALLLVFAIVPVALFANFVRVMILVLLTYYVGDAVAQGFLHDFAGITMFTVAVLTIFGIDHLLAPLRDRLARS